MNFKKITASSLLLAGIAMSPYALADQSFHGHKVNVAFEAWSGDDVSNVLEITNQKDVLARDRSYPDAKYFYVSSPDVDYFDWHIDFNRNVIEMTYVSIEVKYPDYQYSYIHSKGFHFQDTENSLPDIVNVIVDADFAPDGFDPNLVTFDANNIYVNLKGSSCVNPYILIDEPLRFSPGCNNQWSPTSFNNQIKLTVEFASDEATLNQLYDWAESKYPEYLPTHQDSFYIQGYYARYYQGTDVYIGSLKGYFYAYGETFGGLLELGKVSSWLEKMELDEAAINQLYDWLESKYPEYLPTHQDSFYIQRYYARYYQGTNVYVGSLGGILYAYGTQFGGLLDLGELSHWVEEMKKETETGNK